VLLLVLASLRILVTENEVNLDDVSLKSMIPVSEGTYLVGGTALVRTKHDNVRGGIREFVLVELLVLLEELEVGATALEAVCTVLVLIALMPYWCYKP
jgi:hypothetical protein